MPTKRNREYWAERFVLLQESQINKSESYLMDLDREYKKAAMQIERDIAVWYQRIADNNGVSLAAAKRMLTNSELAEFRWTVEEYIKRGKENAIDKRWMRELENASARAHISRLDAIKLQLQQQAELIYGNHLDQTDNLLRDIYSGGFYHTAFEIQRGIGVGAQLAALDDRQIRSVLSKPWAPDGENFSSRIWKDKTRLVNELHSGLMQQVMRGSSPQQAINTIAKRFNTSRTRAGRLVMTESAFFASAGQQDCYKELGIDRFEVVSTLDSDICDDCGDLDGKPFLMTDYVIGVTAPPFHPNCRCCTAPYFDDEFEEGSERAARDEQTGKTYYVPADMTYNEWKLYNNAISREPEITHVMEVATRKNGATLTGMEYRIKTAESFTRKIKSDVAGKHISAVVAMRRVYDTVRYTSILPPKTFANNYMGVIESLKEKGYNILRVKNTLGDPEAVYRGINTIIADTSGFEFELQFHTAQSFAAKQQMHGLYETARATGTSKTEQARLAAEMKRISKAIKRPSGIEQIENFNNLK